MLYQHISALIHKTSRKGIFGKFNQMKAISEVPVIKTSLKLTYAYYAVLLCGIPLSITYYVIKVFKVTQVIVWEDGGGMAEVLGASENPLP